MKKLIVVTVLCLLTASGSLFAARDRFVEIAPSQKAEGYHTKIKLEKQKGGKLLLSLPHIRGRVAWLVVCAKERGKGNRNFRYQFNLSTSRAKNKDIELVSPIHFGEEGVASLQLTEDLATRSYIVFGGFSDDGTFYTVDIPAFQRALKKKPAAGANLENKKTPKEVAEREFDFDQNGPFEFLAYLIRQDERGVKTTQIGDAPKGWIKQDHLDLLVLLMESKARCSSVGSWRSSKLPTEKDWISSTVGHEAAYLISSFRHGLYPEYAANTSATVELDRTELKKWASKNAENCQVVEPLDRAKQIANKKVPPINTFAVDVTVTKVTDHGYVYLKINKSIKGLGSKKLDACNFSLSGHKFVEGKRYLFIGDSIQLLGPIKHIPGGGAETIDYLVAWEILTSADGELYVNYESTNGIPSFPKKSSLIGYKKMIESSGDFVTLLHEGEIKIEKKRKFGKQIKMDWEILLKELKRGARNPK